MAKNLTSKRRRNNTRLPITAKAAIALLPCEDAQNNALSVVLHGVTMQMARTATKLLTNQLCKGISISERIMARMLNGKCYHEVIIDFLQPNTRLLSPQEWLVLTKKMIENIYRCEVIIFNSYEQFMNA